MLTHQLIVGDVLVQRTDEIVPVAEGVGQVEIALAAVGLGIAHQVHPMAGPLLAKPGGLQQPVHYLLISPGRPIFDKG
jgi:hypothetical protein